MVSGFAFGLGELIILLTLGGGAGLPLSMPPAAEDPMMYRVAPADCMYYSTWMGYAQPDGKSANQTERLLSGQELQLLAKKLDQELMAFVASQAADRREDEREWMLAASELTRAAILNHAAFYVSDFEAGEHPTLSAGVVVHIPNQAESHAKQLRELLMKISKEEDYSIIEVGDLEVIRWRMDEVNFVELGAKDDYLIVAVGKETVKEIVARMDADAPEWLKEVRGTLDVDRLATLSYGNLKQAMDRIEEVAGGEDQWSFVESMGLTQLGTFTSFSGLSTDGAVSEMRLELEGEPVGLWKMFDEGGLDAKTLTTIPADTPLAVTLNLKPETIVDVWLEMMQQMQPFAADQMKGMIENGGEMFGFRIREDLLRSFGDRITVYVAPRDGGFMLGWTAAFAINNPMMISDIEAKLVGMLQEMGDAGRGPSIVNIDFEGRTIRQLVMEDDFFPLRMSWCLTGNEIVVALNPQALKSHLRGLSDDEHMADQSRVHQALAQQSGGAPIAIAYVDQAELIEFAYPFVQMMMQFAMREMQSETGMDVDIADFPSVAALTRGVEPALTVVRRTEQGFSVRTEQTLPVGDLGATAPAIAALVLPAVTAAREAAQRTQSANNLKQIMLAMHNYHDVHGGFPAPYSVDADGKPLLSWRVHILPYLEQQALYEQFHLDEPWDSEHNIKLLDQMPALYTVPSGDPTTGKTTYQGISIEDAIYGPLTKDEERQAREAVGRRLMKITDGTSNTIAVVETNLANAVEWSKPVDFEAPEMQPMARLLGNWNGGFQAAFADGSVQFIPEGIRLETLISLFKMNDGGPLDWWEEREMLFRGEVPGDAPHEHIEDAPIEAAPIEVGPVARPPRG